MLDMLANLLNNAKQQCTRTPQERWKRLLETVITEERLHRLWGILRGERVNLHLDTQLKMPQTPPTDFFVLISLRHEHIRL